MQLSKRLIVLIGFSVFMVSAVAMGDAWVGAKGSGDVSMSYMYSKKENMQFEQVAAFSGEPFNFPNGLEDDVKIFGQSTQLGVSYVPIDNLGITASMNYVGNRYSGRPSHAPVFQALGIANADGGETVNGLQDFNLMARYEFDVAGRFALTPSLGFTAPMTDYMYTGFASIGRHLWSADLGFSAGASLNDILRGASVEFGIIHRFTQKVEGWDYNTDITEMSLQANYQIMDSWSVSGSGAFAMSHSALDPETMVFTQTLPVLMAAAPTAAQMATVTDLWKQHDRMLKYSVWNVGLSTSYRFTPAIAASLGAVFAVKTNNLPIANTYSLGFSYSI